MNRKTLLGLSAALALFTAAPLRADDTPSNIHFSAGYKAWATNWTTWDGDREGNLLSITDSAVSHVPNVSFRYKNWFAAGSYISTGNFNFPVINDNEFAPPADLYFYKAKRREWDLNVGYMLPTSEGTSLGVTLGWKDVSQRFHVINTYGGAVFSDYNFKFEASGPTFGITGSASIGHGLALYGNGAGSFMMKVKNDPYHAFGNGNYESAELGLAWRKSMVQLSFGYRYQVLETKFKSGNQNKGEDVTRGYTFGISFVK